MANKINTTGVINNSGKVLSAPIAKQDFYDGKGGNDTVMRKPSDVGPVYPHEEGLPGGATGIGGMLVSKPIKTTDAVSGQVDSLHTTGKK